MPAMGAAFGRHPTRTTWKLDRGVRDQPSGDSQTHIFIADTSFYMRYVIGYRWTYCAPWLFDRRGGVRKPARE